MMDQYQGQVKFSPDFSMSPFLSQLWYCATDSHSYQMVNTEIRLIIFFAAKDGEALYSQQKQDQELTVAQFMNSLLPIQT